MGYQQKSLAPLDKRRVDIIALIFKPYHLSEELNQLDLKIQQKITDLSKILNTFRFTLNGKEVRAKEITQILRSEPDRKTRKQAYLCRAQINKSLVDAGFIDLYICAKNMPIYMVQKVLLNSAWNLMNWSHKSLITGHSPSNNLYRE